MPHSHHEQLSNTLRNAGYSTTTARNTVFAALLSASHPLTFGELQANVATNVDRATVYRVIDVFEKVGVVQKIHTGWKFKLELTDQFHVHHHHITCRICGMVTTLPEDAVLEAHIQKSARASRFTLENHQIELQGICMSCEKHETPAIRS